MIGRGDLEKLFRHGFDGDDVAVIQQQAFAATQMFCARQIEQHGFALRCRQHQPAAMAMVMVEPHLRNTGARSHLILRNDGGGAAHGVLPPSSEQKIALCERQFGHRLASH